MVMSTSPAVSCSPAPESLSPEEARRARPADEEPRAAAAEVVRSAWRRGRVRLGGAGPVGRGGDAAWRSMELGGGKEPMRDGRSPPLPTKLTCRSLNTPQRSCVLGMRHRPLSRAVPSPSLAAGAVSSAVLPDSPPPPTPPSSPRLAPSPTSPAVLSPSSPASSAAAAALPSDNAGTACQPTGNEMVRAEEDGGGVPGAGTGAFVASGEAGALAAAAPVFTKKRSMSSTRSCSAATNSLAGVAAGSDPAGSRVLDTAGAGAEGIAASSAARDGGSSGVAKGRAGHRTGRRSRTAVAKRGGMAPGAGI